MKIVGSELKTYWKINKNWHSISKVFINATILIEEMSVSINRIIFVSLKSKTLAFFSFAIGNANNVVAVGTRVRTGFYGINSVHRPN